MHHEKFYHQSVQQSSAHVCHTRTMHTDKVAACMHAHLAAVVWQPDNVWHAQEEFAIASAPQAHGEEQSKVNVIRTSMGTAAVMACT